jgi:hypothetical protein
LFSGGRKRNGRNGYAGLDRRIVSGEQCDQFRDWQRLREVVITPGLDTPFAIPHHGVGGDGDNWRCQTAFAQFAGDLQTADLARQLNIHQDQIELLTAQLDQRNLAFCIGHDIMLSHPGNTFHEGEVRCIIFDVSNTHLGFPYTSLHSRA